MQSFLEDIAHDYEHKNQNMIHKDLGGGAVVAKMHRA
jgi:hypothetical protein